VIATHYSSVQPIDLSPSSDVVDFDATFAETRKEQGIPEIFDRLVGYLAEIIVSGEVEYVAVKDALVHLKALLEAHRFGSYTSFMSIWEVIQIFGKHQIFAYLKKFGGPSVEGIHKAIEELDEKKRMVEATMKEAARRSLIEHSPKIEAIQPKLTEEIRRIAGPVQGESDKPSD